MCWSKAHWPGDMYGIARLVCRLCICMALIPTITLSSQLVVKAASSTTSTWNVAPSSNVAGLNSELRALSAYSARNIWAVGNSSQVGSSNVQTLAEQWDGTKWSIVATPNSGAAFNTLTSVVTLSARNAWAVGYSAAFTATGAIFQTLIEHWNGQHWDMVPSPNAGAGYNVLIGVTAISASDIWAVGSFANCVPNCSGPYQTLIEHWDGLSWSIVPSPNPTGSSSFTALNAVTAISSSDVWAIGSFIAGSYQTLIEHWDGTKWSIVSSPNVGSSSNFNDLYSITALSSSDIWAVGNYNTATNVEQTLTEHWNGISWSVVVSPNMGAGNNGLQGVVAVSATSIWAVGFSYTDTNMPQSLIEQWNGTSWNVVTGPSVGSTSSVLWGIARVPGNHYLWAVGSDTNASSGLEQTLTAYKR